MQRRGVSAKYIMHRCLDFFVMDDGLLAAGSELTGGGQSVKVCLAVELFRRMRRSEWDL